MTQEKLAIMSKVDRRTVQRAEQGTRLQMETLASLAAALNVPVAQIVVAATPADEVVDELQSKSLVVLNRIQSGMTLLNIVRDSYEGSISCEADPTPENIEALTAVVSKLEELMPQPWAPPQVQLTLALSERLRAAVSIGEQLRQLEALGVAFFAGTYTARTQVPRYDDEMGNMYITDRTPYELVTICRVIVAPLSQGDRLTIKAKDIYVPPKPVAVEAEAEPTKGSDDIPF